MYRSACVLVLCFATLATACSASNEQNAKSSEVTTRHVDSFEYVPNGAFANAPEALLLVSEVHARKVGRLVVVVKEGALCANPYNPHPIIVTNASVNDLKRGDIVIYGFPEISGTKAAAIRKLGSAEKLRYQNMIQKC